MNTPGDAARRVAYVTGVSRGLGAALAAALADAGWRVTGIGRSVEPALAREGVELLACDLRDVEATAAAAGAAMRDAAAVGAERALLVNNAAVAGPIGRLGELDARELAQSLAVNLVATAVLANAFCAAFVRGERRVVNVSSGLAARAMTGAGAYSVAKCGMEMLTRALAADHAGPDFAAVTFRPGIIDTPMQEYMRSRPASALPEVAMFARFHESGELVEPARVARVALGGLVDRDVESGRTYSYAELAAGMP